MSTNILEPLHRHPLLNSLLILEEKPGQASTPHRVVDVRYNERERTWQLLVVCTITGEMSAWYPRGVRVVQRPAAPREPGGSL